jgi:type IV fimbrial biogenesis protein FimT
VPFSFADPHSRGFTLPEAITVLAVVSILSTVGVSSYQGFIIHSQLDAMSMRLRTDLMLARSEAIKRGQRVTLCRLPPDSNRHCAGHSYQGKPSWRHGWLIYADVDADRLLDQSKGDEILGVYAISGSPLQLKWNRGDYVSYGGEGALASGSGSFCVGDDTGVSELQRRLVIPWSGRLRTADEACGYEFP